MPPEIEPSFSFVFSDIFLFTSFNAATIKSSSTSDSSALIIDLSISIFLTRVFHSLSP